MDLSTKKSWGLQGESSFMGVGGQKLGRSGQCGWEGCMGRVKKSASGGKDGREGWVAGCGH